MNKSLVLGAVSLLLTFTGCQSKRILPMSTDRSTDVTLAEAATATNRQYNRYVSSVSDKPALSITQGQTSLPMSLSRPMSINWNGPLSELLNEVANDIGYHLKVFGRKPALSVIVNLDVQDLRVIDVIQEAQAQSSMQAHIDIDTTSHVIALSYQNQGA